jgi:FkbM family methyltransferase
MISVVKKLLQSTPLYPMVREWHHARALRVWGPDDAARLEFYSQFIHPGDLVFDVGANVGNRTKIFLRLGARVVAFEPQASCARVLQRALAKNASFQLVRKALGDKPGTAELRIGAAPVLATLSEEWINATLESGRFGAEKWDEREQVLVTTLDDAMKEFGNPVFSKVDVEGFEPKVFAGLSQPLQRGSLEFAAEFLDGTLWCLEKLENLQRCAFQFSAAETMHFDWPAWLDLPEARVALRNLAQRDRFAWGDVYFKRAASLDS